MMRFIGKILDDVLILAGGVCIVFGVSLISVPAAWIVGGVLLVGLGVMIGMGNRG